MNKYIVRIYLGGFFMEYAKDIILEFMSSSYNFSYQILKKNPKKTPVVVK